MTAEQVEEDWVDEFRVPVGLVDVDDVVGESVGREIGDADASVLRNPRFSESLDIVAIHLVVIGVDHDDHFASRRPPVASGFLGGSPEEKCRNKPFRGFTCICVVESGLSGE